MSSTVRALRVALPALLAALLAAAPAPAQTTVTAEATIWSTPGVPADSAARVVARVSDPGGAALGVAERIALYLPPAITLSPAGLPGCPVELALRDVGACPAGSQVGSGRVVTRVGPAQAQVTADAYVVLGDVPGQVVVALQQVGGGLRSGLPGQVGPSDDPAFGSMVALTVPHELRHPAGLDNALGELDLLLRANGAGAYVAVGDCPPAGLPLRALATFDQTAEGPRPGPLRADFTATCAAGPPPQMPSLPPAESPPPGDVAPPAPVPPLPPAAERAVAAFGVKLQRRAGAVRRLRLIGVERSADVSVRCLRRCGRRGSELLAKRRGRTAKLKRALKPGTRFELRVSAGEAVTRFTRFRVGARGKAARRVGGGCLDAGGKPRACPA
jgi:hypothetical protein